MEIGEGTKAVLPKLSSHPSAIKSLVVRCGHGRSSSQRLQVVPERTLSDSAELKAPGLEFSLDKEFGGEDQVAATVQTMDGGGSKQASCAGPDENPSWQSAPVTFSLDPPDLEECLWPLEVAPVTHVITGKGGDDSTLSVDVDVFPTERYEATLSLDPKYDLVEKLVGGVNKFLGKVCHASPADVKLQVQGPSGSASLSWGWEEDPATWRAYFAFAGEFGIDPILKIGVRVEVSLLSAAGMTVGIPPGITRLIGRHLADILVGVGVALEGSFTGKLESRTYAAGKIEARGAVTMALTGTGTLDVAARLGSDQILSLSLTAGGTCGIRGEGTLAVQQAGLYYSPGVEMLPLKLHMVVRTRAAHIFSTERTNTWTVWDGADLYRPGPRRLWPPDTAAAGNTGGAGS